MTFRPQKETKIVSQASEILAVMCCKRWPDFEEKLLFTNCTSDDSGRISASF